MSCVIKFADKLSGQVSSAFLLAEGDKVYSNKVKAYATVEKVCLEHEAVHTDLADIGLSNIGRLLLVDKDAIDENLNILPGSILVHKETGTETVVVKDTDKGIYVGENTFVSIDNIHKYFVVCSEGVVDSLEEEEDSEQKDTNDLHYNGWSTLEDHIRVYGAVSGYQAIMFVVRKYQDRAHLKGSLLDDLRKMQKYLAKAEELVKDYDLEKHFDL